MNQRTKQRTKQSMNQNMNQIMNQKTIRRTKKMIKRNWKKIEVGVIAFAVILIFIIAFKANVPTADAAEMKEKYFTCVEVEKGDTLWSLAKEYGKEFDEPEVFIKEVKNINKLSGDTIYEDAYLIVPVYK